MTQLCIWFILFIYVCKVIDAAGRAGDDGRVFVDQYGYERDGLFMNRKGYRGDAALSCARDDDPGKHEMDGTCSTIFPSGNGVKIKVEERKPVEFVMFDFDQTLTIESMYGWEEGEAIVTAFGGRQRIGELGAFFARLQSRTVDGDSKPVELIITSLNKRDFIEKALKEVNLLHYFTDNICTRDRGRIEATEKAILIDEEIEKRGRGFDAEQMLLVDDKQAILKEVDDKKLCATLKAGDSRNPGLQRHEMDIIEKMVGGVTQRPLIE